MFSNTSNSTPAIMGSSSKEEEEEEDGVSVNVVNGIVVLVLALIGVFSCSFALYLLFTRNSRICGPTPVHPWLQNNDNIINVEEQRQYSVTSYHRRIHDISDTR